MNFFFLFLTLFAVADAPMSDRGGPRSPWSADPAECGNGRIDFTVRTVCASCPPSSAHCPCSDQRVPTEQCDGQEMGKRGACEQHRFLGGVMACSETCRYDTEQCLSTIPSVSTHTLSGGPPEEVKDAITEPGAMVFVTVRDTDHTVALYKIKVETGTPVLLTRFALTRTVPTRSASNVTHLSLKMGKPHRVRIVATPLGYLIATWHSKWGGVIHVRAISKRGTLRPLRFNTQHQEAEKKIETLHSLTPSDPPGTYRLTYTMTSHVAVDGTPFRIMQTERRAVVLDVNGDMLQEPRQAIADPERPATFLVKGGQIVRRNTTGPSEVIAKGAFSFEVAASRDSKDIWLLPATTDQQAFRVHGSGE
jgi:hypothetical protein